MSLYSHQIFESFPELRLQAPYHLRLPMRKDADDYLGYLSHPKVACYVPDNSLPTNVPAAEACLQYFRDLYHRKQAVYWGIYKNDGGQMIGSCGFEHWSLQHKRLELAYDLNPDYWKRGIMTEALSMILDVAFSKMDANRIDAFTTTDNKDSIKLLEKLGFVCEGTLRDYRFFKGKFIDVFMFGLIKKDYKKR